MSDNEQDEVSGPTSNGEAALMPVLPSGDRLRLRGQWGIKWRGNGDQRVFENRAWMNFNLKVSTYKISIS